MNADELLRQWIQAERHVDPPTVARHQGWQRLTQAVSAGTPAMAVPLSTIPVATVSLFAEGAAVAIVVGSLGTAAIVATAPANHPATAPHPSAASSAGPSSLETVAPNATGAEAAVPVAPTPSARSSASRVASVPTESSTQAAGEPPITPSATAASTSPLDEELKLLGRAKREIDRGQYHLAAVWLDEHRSRFPGGMLAAEREGLAVLMACSGGISSASRLKAEAFVRAYPASPLLDRIRRACQLDREDAK